MAWEKRGNRNYFYQKERIGKTVKSVYIGKDEIAVLFDRCDKDRQNLKKMEKENERRIRERSEIVDEQIEAVSEINQSLVDALFLANGFHQHKRQWRKIRK